jgi:hypothetical protein
VCGEGIVCVFIITPSEFHHSFFFFRRQLLGWDRLTFSNRRAGLVSSSEAVAL